MAASGIAVRGPRSLLRQIREAMAGGGPAQAKLDMVVRTSGEQRLSNFMLWRAAYSELFFLEKYWPDMTKQDVADIIKEYNRRSRRFGGN